uniref:DUF1758 domain-containing protein n=1 Tax=Heterorhabditis bacteriophora TaxID=37862 RepID=A0A1I7XBI4_HETBA
MLNTTQLRKEFIQKNNMCLNCGATNHRVHECKSKRCNNCNKPHHTSICFRSTNQSSAKKPATYGKPMSGSRSASHNYVAEDIKNDAEEEDNTILRAAHHTKDSPQRMSNDKVILLVGTAKTLNDKENKLQDVDILLDTDSELSFIDTKLSTSLGLAILEEKNLLIHKFGSNHPERQPSRVTAIDIFDKCGMQHRLQLHTSDIITSPLEYATLSTDDRQFIVL